MTERISEAISQNSVEETNSTNRENERLLRTPPPTPGRTREPMLLSWSQIIKVSLHWRCLILTLLVYACVIMIIWCEIPVHKDIYSETLLLKSCRNGLVWIPATVSILFYMLYIIECLHCKIHQELKNLISTSEAHRLMKNWSKAKPCVKWRAVSYHYGRSVRQYESSTGSHISPQMYYTRITSQVHEDYFQPYDCGSKDKSTLLTNIDNFAVIKVDIEKYFTFNCTCSEMAYLTQRKMFYDEHLTEDDYIELQETFHLMSTGQIPEMMCIMKCTQHVPWYYNKILYWVLSIIGLSWPLRMIIEKNTAYGSFTIHKQFGATCNGQLALLRDNTVSSYDSKLSDNVYGVIPSYSEALLMSSYNVNGLKMCTSELNEDPQSAADIRWKLSTMKTSKTINDLQTTHRTCKISIKRSISYTPQTPHHVITNDMALCSPSFNCAPLHLPQAKLKRSVTLGTGRGLSNLITQNFGRSKSMYTEIKPIEI